MSLRFGVFTSQEGSTARKSPNKFGFSLAYSYFLLCKKVLQLGKVQINLAFRSLIRTFAG